MGKIIDWIMNFLYDLAAAALSVLPDSPFQTDQFQNALKGFQELMGQINYFIPFGKMFIMMSIYIAAVLIWYGLRWILRFAKYIE